MFHASTTLEGYRHADSDTRLEMFLHHRELRPAFDGIERNDRAAPSSRTRPAPVSGPVRSLVRRCCSWLV